MKFLHTATLYDAVTIAKNGTGYTSSIAVDFITGYAAVLVTTSAGSITITQQISDDNINWYDPVNSDGTALGAVGAAVTVGTTYRVVSPVMGRFLRYKIVEGNVAETVVTLKLIYQEE